MSLPNPLHANGGNCEYLATGDQAGGHGSDWLRP